MLIQAGITRRVAFAATVAAAMLLGGCGGGVSLEGPGFEALGLTGNKNKKDVKVPDRAPLLLPPDRARLPEPQQPTAVAAQQQDWPSDPDLQRKAEEEEVAVKEREYEDYGDWSKNADLDEFEKLMDPAMRSKGIFGKGRALDKKYRDTRDYGN